jgi:hypothetical protein
MGDRPISIMKSPVPIDQRPEQVEASKELTEEQQRRTELDRRNVVKGNRVAQLLGSVKYYVTNQRFPFLVQNGMPLSVTEYYPDLKVAVDKFMNFSDWTQAETDYKSQIFKKHGIKYAFLHPRKSLGDMARELGLENTKEK